MYYINVFKNGSLVAASGFILEQDALIELARLVGLIRKIRKTC